MIIHTEPWYDGTELQIVNGEDIMLSYKNNSKVSSCMSNHERWKRTAFWKHVPGAKLIRAMKDDVLLLRALLWETIDEATGNTVKFLDRVYAKSYPYDYCPSLSQKESHPGIIDAFTAKWQEYADLRSTAKRLITEVKLDSPPEEVPSADTFVYLSEDLTQLSNKSFGRCYYLGNHITGELGVLH